MLIFLWCTTNINGEGLIVRSLIASTGSKLQIEGNLNIRVCKQGDAKHASNLWQEYRENTALYNSVIEVIELSLKTEQERKVLL